MSFSELLQDISTELIAFAIIGIGAIAYRRTHAWWRNQSTQRQKAFEARVVSESSSPASIERLLRRINHAITLTFMAIFTLMILLILAQIAEQFDFLSTAISAYFLALIVLIFAGRTFIKVTAEYEVFKEIIRRTEVELERMKSRPNTEANLDVD